MDSNSDKKLSKEELKYGLSDIGVDINFQELDHIMTLFDIDHNGYICFDELLVGLRGQMNKRRLDLVHMAFRVLDKTSDGKITIDDLRLAYDTSKHPEVLSGKISERQALMNFMDIWDSNEKDGIITLEEFENYYKVRMNC